ncbi:ABC transporter substrate-binding protein [Massilia sp. IC2-278]|uniref:ABC transporter substrate-binding protein n=1 Tax=Massilia sp. IC2-278 TaxID=2887200 RepID=UPI000E902FF2|nr:ABC transporter substrate-binding protein [Massilia sp. IC2-278]MCC2959656.1 ABC transporter substrate-binding protein [Massilia sp. IC2-278]HBI67966.1 amino acid ABC transporter substrate-binding protein [Massilia sp.]
MGNRRTFIAVAAALAAQLSFAATAHADQLADIKKKGEIVFGVLGTDEPNSFIDPKTRELVGYEIDLAKAVAKKIGVKPVFKQLSVAARIPELQQGHVDVLAATLTHNKERESQVDFALTHFVTGSKVMVRSASGIKALPQLAGKKVVTVRGGTQETNIRAAVPTANIVTFENTQQAFQALQQGKGIAYVNDESSLLADYGKLGPAAKNFTILPTSIGVESIALGLRKGEKNLKGVVDATLRELETSGAANQLFNKWYGPGTRPNIAKRNFTISTDKI